MEEMTFADIEDVSGGFVQVAYDAGFAVGKAVVIGGALLGLVAAYQALS